MHGVLGHPGLRGIGLEGRGREDEIATMVAWLASNPGASVAMRGTGGARKVRFAGKGKGKSGGYRTIHYVGGDDIPIFLLALIDKGERDNLSKAECNALAAELSQLADDYRSGTTARLTAMRRRM